METRHNKFPFRLRPLLLLPTALLLLSVMISLTGSGVEASYGHNKSNPGEEVDDGGGLRCRKRPQDSTDSFKCSHGTCLGEYKDGKYFYFDKGRCCDSYSYSSDCYCSKPHCTSKDGSSSTLECCCDPKTGSLCNFTVDGDDATSLFRSQSGQYQLWIMVLLLVISHVYFRL